LRLSGHNANGNNFNSEHINISVYVALIEYPHIPSEVEYTEFKIAREMFDKDSQSVVREIVIATEKALNGDMFTMSAGIAEEKHYTSQTEGRANKQNIKENI
ncbi:MAG: hypothetical protein J5862_04255, partial [Bacteroidales bacterium]|nr:hypothetical protein [Bacteroidales bacterium]